MKTATDEYAEVVVVKIKGKRQGRINIVQNGKLGLWFRIPALQAVKALKTGVINYGLGQGIPVKRYR